MGVRKLYRLLLPKTVQWKNANRIRYEKNKRKTRYRVYNLKTTGIWQIEASNAWPALSKTLWLPS